MFNICTFELLLYLYLYLSVAALCNISSLEMIVGRGPLIDVSLSWFNDVSSQHNNITLNSDSFQCLLAAAVYSVQCNYILYDVPNVQSLLRHKLQGGQNCQY